MKTVYETPEVIELGSFEELTQAKATGANIDGTYPAGTPAAGHLS